MISSLLFTIALGTTHLDCSLEEGKRVVDYNGIHYKQLSALVSACPEVRQQEHRNEFARVANFLFKGLTYEVIDDIAAFKKEYRERVAKEANGLDTRGPRISDYGLFDVSGMHGPQIRDDKMVFYVRHSKTELPYEVSVALSPNRKKASYHLLPFLGGEISPVKT